MTDGRRRGEESGKAMIRESGGGKTRAGVTERRERGQPLPLSAFSVAPLSAFSPRARSTRSLLPFAHVILPPLSPSSSPLTRPHRPPPPPTAPHPFSHRPFPPLLPLPPHSLPRPGSTTCRSRPAGRWRPAPRPRTPRAQRAPAAAQRLAVLDGLHLGRRRQRTATAERVAANRDGRTRRGCRRETALPAPGCLVRLRARSGGKAGTVREGRRTGGRWGGAARPSR